MSSVGMDEAKRREQWLNRQFGEWTPERAPRLSFLPVKDFLIGNSSTVILQSPYY